MSAEHSVRAVLADVLLRRMLGFTACSSLASGVFLGALPLAVASRGGGPFLVGLVAAALSIWWVAAMPLGTLVDRKGAGPIMARAVPLRMAAVLLIGAHALFTGAAAIAVIFAGALLYGLIDTVADSAGSALPALLLSEGQYDGAYSLLYSTGRIANLVVGPVAGATLLVIATPLPFLIASVALFVGYLFNRPLCRDPRAHATNPDASIGWRDELMAGLKHLWSDRFLRAMITTLVGVVIAEELVFVTVQPYFRDGSGFADWAQILGALRSTSGICAILAAFSAAALAARFPRTRVLSVVAVGAALCPAVLAISPSIAPVVIALSISAIAESIWVPLVSSEVARRTPSHLMVRTRCAMMFITWGSLPVTSLAGGALAEGVGIRPVLLVASAAALLSCIFGVWREFVRGDATSGRTLAAVSEADQAPTAELTQIAENASLSGTPRQEPSK